ncbi:TetR/AcrR family transcriptional regulator C-terminal domain-containing protein [Saccharothrix violaceirubra]|uniref:AcrR family transcriptional regulator n=1 Tax=Saccharothrix violaceirubra TaxID=413306 RepID=A0A7W7T440_9PSEU|nr:TetR/AcrR family transcriptional regulator [Saccharothrix violaceirubra]MBB4966203.1 AcrR family transcriptional regulator [Saccharothrix violaceirubra]
MPARLTHARVVDAAAQVADRGGLAHVTMRNVGRELGVEAMSLYHHVAGKDALLDSLTEWIFARIDLPDVDAPWRTAMADRATSVRTVLSGHTWALGLIESRRSPGPWLLRHHDAVLGCLRRNGFPVALAASAYSVLDAYVFGFVLTELNLPFEPGESAAEFVAQLDLPTDHYPHLAELVAEQITDPGYSYGAEFDRGLALVLDGLEARLG